MEEHIRDEKEVQIAAVGGQQDYRPLANSLLDLAWRRKEKREVKKKQLYCRKA